MVTAVEASAAPGIALFQHEGNGDLRVIVGGEGHEHAVIFQAAAQLGRAVLAPAETMQSLK